MTWTARYSNSGGYDCMTDAIIIEGPHYITLDLANYGQKRGGEADLHMIATAARDAQTIIDALNARDSQEKS